MSENIMLNKKKLAHGSYPPTFLGWIHQVNVLKVSPPTPLTILDKAVNEYLNLVIHLCIYLRNY